MIAAVRAARPITIRSVRKKRIISKRIKARPRWKLRQKSALFSRQSLQSGAVNHRSSAAVFHDFVVDPAISLLHTIAQPRARFPSEKFFDQRIVGVAPVHSF